MVAYRTMALTFTDLIIISTVLLSIFLFLVQRISSTSRKKSEWRLNTWPMRLLGGACLVSSTSLILLSFFTRGDAWFILRVVSLCAVAFYSLFKKNSFVIPVYLLINVISSSVAPIISLGFSAGETDQIGHLLAANYIISNHEITRSQDFAFGNAQYYNVFPMVDFLVSSTSLASGANPFLSFAVLEVVIPVLATLALLVISYVFTGDFLPAVVAVLILLATDRLAIWVLIPQNLSAAYAIVAILCLILFLSRPSISLASLTLLFSLFSNFAHASFGGFLLLTLLLLSFIIYMRRFAFWSQLITLVLSAIVGLSSYWAIWNTSPNVSANINSVVQSFLNAISGKLFHLVGARSTSLVALITPYNFLSWAVPPALAFSYVAYYLISGRFRISNKLDAFLVSSTGVGLFILIVGLFSTYNQGSIALERYTDIPAYVAMMITGSFGAVAIIKGGRKLLVCLIIALLLASLLAGSVSLDWTPDQITSTYGYVGHQEYIFSRSLSALLPSGINIFFAQKLMYAYYLNSSKTAEFVPAADTFAINSNRSTSTSYLVSFTLHSRTNVYYAIGPSIVTDYSNLTYSPNMDFVLSNGQYVVIIARP